MAGQMSFGKRYNNAGAGKIRDAKAFAEGVQYRASGVLLERPPEANPHQPNPIGSGSPDTNTPSTAHDAWATGWAFAELSSGSELDVTGLSIAPVGVIPT